MSSGGCEGSNRWPSTPGVLARGRVAVVTGAASGIGPGLAERCAAEGMHVAMADVEAPALGEAVAQLSGIKDAQN